MRFFLLVLSAITFISMQNASAEITCIEAPKCSDLGYDLSAEDCVGRKYTVCPYDSTAYSCDTTTCEDLGFTDNIAECPGEYDVCQYDKTKGKCIYEASPGDLKYSFRTSDHNGWLLCDGKAYFKEQFPDLYEAIKSSYPSKLPDYAGYFIKGASTTVAADFGKPEEAGLPNITGSRFLGWNDSSAIGILMHSSGNSDLSALYATKEKTQYYTKSGSTSASGSQHLSTLNFDASRSNSIYGKSTTVTPQNYKANVFIFAGKDLFKKVKEEGVSGKYLYSDGTVAGVYYPDKTLLGYGVTSSTVVVGGNDYVTGNTLSEVKSAINEACKEKGGSYTISAAQFKKIMTDVVSDKVVYPVSADRSYFVGTGVFDITSSGGLQAASFSASDNYYYYCKIILQ